MDGVLVIDKPCGPTSHDIVALARRALRDRRIGHTGTLDPAASGVLPLVIGKATRLARFLSSGDKIYEARVRLGASTDTYDADGRVTGAVHTGALPSPAEIDAALAAFRGTFLQRPPAFSAKKVGGVASHRAARAASRASHLPLTADQMPVAPAATAVTAHRIDVLRIADGDVDLHIHCGAGFYVRSLAHDLGAALGIGGHLAALRRLECCGFRLADAIGADQLDDAEAVATKLVPPRRMLAGMAGFTLTDEGLRHVRHGRALPAGSFVQPDAVASWAAGADSGNCRLLDPVGDLVAIAVRRAAAPAPAILHPLVVLM